MVRRSLSDTRCLKVLFLGDSKQRIRQRVIMLYYTITSSVETINSKGTITSRRQRAKHACQVGLREARVYQSDPAIDRAIARSSERKTDRAMDRAIEGATERPSDRGESDQVRDRATDQSIVPFSGRVFDRPAVSSKLRFIGGIHWNYLSVLKSSVDVRYTYQSSS